MGSFHAVSFGQKQVGPSNADANQQAETSRAHDSRWTLFNDDRLSLSQETE